MRASMAQPRVATSFLRERQRRAACDGELHADEIDAVHDLRDGMLDLQTRVHLQEVERTVFVEQELDGPGVRIIHGLLPREPQPRPCVRADRYVERQRRRFFENFLVAPLDRALAFAEMNRGAVQVGNDLEFDVARPRDVALQEHGRIAERREGFALRRFERFVETREIA